MRAWKQGVALLLALCLAPAVAAQETFDSGSTEEEYLDPGDTFSFTFTEEFAEGHYYHCHPHEWMWAMVHVLADEDGETTTHQVSIVEKNASDVDSWGYEPQHLVIEVGDTVVWTNDGQLQHTVSYGNPNSEDGHHHGEDGHHDDHIDDHMDDETNTTPGFELAIAVAAIAGVGLLRRRD